MARERYLVGVSEEELRPDPKPEGPKTPKGKWENFWYHYKWHTLAAAFAAIVLFVCIYQVVTRDDPDYTVILATQSYVTEAATDQLAATLESYGQDLDKDGKVEVSVEALCLGGDTQTGMAYQQKFIAHLSAGDVMFYILDKDTYEQNILPQMTDGYQFFSPLETAVSGVEGDGRYWNWKDSSLRSNAAFTGMPENLYFGVRVVSGTAKNSAKLNAQCLELLRAMLSDKAVTAAPTAASTTTASAQS